MFPAQVYHSDDTDDSDLTVEGGLQIGPENEHTSTFFETVEQKIRSVKNKKAKKPRKTVSRLVSGKELTSNEVMEAIKNHEQNQKPTLKKFQETQKGKLAVKKGKQIVATTAPSPVAGPSCVDRAVDCSSNSSDSDEASDEKCCVCHRFQPKELSGCISLAFVKWVQCDGLKNGIPCKHWTHLTFCTPVRCVRRGDKFLCCHCNSNEE